MHLVGAAGDVFRRVKPEDDPVLLQIEENDGSAIALRIDREEDASDAACALLSTSICSTKCASEAMC